VTFHTSHMTLIDFNQDSLFCHLKVEFLAQSQ